MYLLFEADDPGKVVEYFLLLPFAHLSCEWAHPECLEGMALNPPFPILTDLLTERRPGPIFDAPLTFWNPECENQSEATLDGMDDDDASGLWAHVSGAIALVARCRASNLSLSMSFFG